MAEEPIPTPEDARKVSIEAAHALLTKINRLAHGVNIAGDVKALAEAYATVTDAMPKPRSSGRSVVTG